MLVGPQHKASRPSYWADKIAPAASNLSKLVELVWRSVATPFG